MHSHVVAAAFMALAAASPLAARDTTCALTGSDVRYHVSPSASSAAPGQFGAAGTKVTFTCWTSGGDDTDWVRDTKGYYVSTQYITSECYGTLLYACELNYVY